MSSVFICENYVLCSNKDADKDVNVTEQLWELQPSVVPGSALSDCPCATGPRVAAPQSGAWQLWEPAESPLQARDSTAGPTWASENSRSHIHVTGNSGLGGLVCLEAFCGTNNTGWSAHKTILALGTQSI